MPRSFIAATRGHRAALVALVALGAVYLWLNAFDALGSLHGDGLIYFLTAMQYAPYWPHDALAESVAATSQFPPVYSFLLMLCGGGASFLAAHLATTAFLLVSFAAFYAWLLTLGIGRLRACLGAAAFAIMPGTFRQSFYLHPEGLYITLAFIALAGLELAERSRAAWLFWAASAAVALALMTRTAGVTLLPGFAISLLRHRPRAWLGMLLLPLVPACAWSLVHHPAMSYSEALVSKYGHGGALPALLGDIGKLVATIGDGLVWNVIADSGLQAVGVAFGIIAMVVALWRFVRWKADAWYLAAYLAVLAIWPYPQEAWRLTWAVVPIMLGYFFWLGTFVYAEWPKISGNLRDIFGALPVAVFAALVIPSFILSMTRAAQATTLGETALRHMPEWYADDPRRAYRVSMSELGVVDALREFAALIPEGECIYSPSPLITAYFTDRNARFTPWEYRDDSAFDADLRNTGCRYFVMVDIPTRYSKNFYPKDRLGDRLEIVALHRLHGGETGGAVVAMLGVLKPVATTSSTGPGA